MEFNARETFTFYQCDILKKNNCMQEKKQLNHTSEVHSMCALTQKKSDCMLRAALSNFHCSALSGLAGHLKDSDMA